jgi:hypothetical protein
MQIDVLTLLQKASLDQRKALLGLLESVNPAVAKAAQERFEQVQLSTQIREFLGSKEGLDLVARAVAQKLVMPSDKVATVLQGLSWRIGPMDPEKAKQQADDMVRELRRSKTSSKEPYTATLPNGASLQARNIAELYQELRAAGFARPSGRPGGIPLSWSELERLTDPSVILHNPNAFRKKQ